MDCAEWKQFCKEQGLAEATKQAPVIMMYSETSAGMLCTRGEEQRFKDKPGLNGVHVSTSAAWL